MPRYKAHIAYKGTHYAGWQRQPNAMTIQEQIETCLSTLLQSDITIVGCGRTDAGVHASNYIFHFDVDDDITIDLEHRLNQMLPKDIAVLEINQTTDTFHARFDATTRTYRYYLIRNKSPYFHEIKTHYPKFKIISRDLLEDCAQLILNSTEFYPFCKSKHDSETMICLIKQSEWKFTGDEYIYTISANRFLRGMVRLIVGMSLRVAIGEVPIDDVKYALDHQTRITKSWSAPAEGLFLEEIDY